MFAVIFVVLVLHFYVEKSLQAVIYYMMLHSYKVIENDDDERIPVYVDQIESQSVLTR